MAESSVEGGESSVIPTCRSESSSVAPDTNKCSSDQNERNPPLSDDNAIPDISRQGSSAPDASLLGNEHTRDSRDLETKSQSRCPRRHFPARRIHIPMNCIGKPVGVDDLQLRGFLDYLTGDGHRAPLNYSGWGAMPEVFKENMWKEVQENYFIDHPRAKFWIMSDLGRSWNRWIDMLKRKHYLNCATNEERLANLDEKVLPDQWEYLVSYWDAEKAEATAAAKKPQKNICKKMEEQPPLKKQKMAEQVKIPFATGVSDLLKLMNGISHGYKEVFLRELVLNAAQALSKMRRETLYECDLIGGRGLFIDIIPDKSNHTLSIADNGVGMTEDDLKNQLFTVPVPALERHKKAARHLQNNEVAVDEFYKFNLDFHLGFFAAFMVADNVEITTKCYGGDKPCMLFASARDRSFSIVVGDQSDNISTPRGTKVTLQLNKDVSEFLDEGSLNRLIDKYTFDLVPYPISIIVQRLADVEEKKKDMDELKSQFEGLRKLFVEVISGRNADFKNAVISDRMYDLPAFVSLDRATIEINPRDSLIKKLRQDAMNNPEDKNLLETITGLYSSGVGQSLLHAAKASVRHNYPRHARLDSSMISDSFQPPRMSSLHSRLGRFRDSLSSMYPNSLHNPPSGTILVPPVGESSLLPTCRPESSVAPDTHNCSTEEYEMDQNEPGPPLSDDNAIPDISQPGSSTPEASPLGNEHTRDSKAKQIIIPTDTFGRPIGGDALKLQSLLDTISRDGHKAPLNYSGWGAMPEEFKENMWKEIQENFFIDHPRAKFWIMSDLGRSWNEWKASLKRDCYLNCQTNAGMLANLEERVLPDQWEYLVSYWNTLRAEGIAAARKPHSIKSLLEEHCQRSL